jgi:hypothetical protein
MRRVLLLILFTMAVFVQAQEENQLVLDEALIVTLSADRPTRLLYIADEAQTITLIAQAVSENVDAPDVVLWIVDNDNHLLAYNDNVGDDSNPKINKLYLPQSGFYTIYVDSFNGVSEGEVEVIIQQVNRFNEQFEASENSLVIRATLPEDSIYLYELELSEVDIITITAQDTSGTFDPYLRILDSEGNMLVANDDHNSTDISLDIFDTRISNWAALGEGIYSIEVRDFLGRGGTFELIIEFISS